MQTQAPATARSFQEDVRTVASRVRAALSAVITALPGPPRHARELARVLRVDATLGWKVFKVAHGGDPLSAALHIPTRAALNGFRKAALRLGVSSDLLDALDSAIDDYEGLIETHAGDRATFDTMLSGHALSGADIPLSHRRAAFHANSSIWGVQAEAQLTAAFFAPAARPGMLDLVGIRGFVGLKRLRPDVSWVVGRVRAAPDQGVPNPGVVWEPLDDDADASPEIPLLRRFCTHPLPRLRAVRTASGIIEHEVVEGPVGNTGAVTCFTGQVARNAVSSVPDETNRLGEVGVAVRTPCALLLLDLFMHESVFGRLAPQVRVYSELLDQAPYPTGGRERGILPLREEVIYLGKGPMVAHSPAVPRYTEMAAFVFERLGWDGERFDLYRVSMRFPVVPSLVVLSHPL